MNLKNTVIVFDTNIYLDIYRFSPDYANFVLNALKQLQKSIIMPMTIFCEFERNHKKAFSERQKSIENCAQDSIQLINNQKNAIQNSFKRLKLGKFPDIDQLISSTAIKYDEAIKEINDYFDKHTLLEIIKDSWTTDEVEEFVKILAKNGRVLSDLTLLQIYNLCDIAEERYKNEIPPGFCDEKHKAGIRPYSDYFWWHEVIEYARKAKSNVIIVTDDAKRDFWDIESMKLLPELIKEFKKETKYKDDEGATIELSLTGYTSKDFFDKFAKDNDVDIPDAIDVFTSMTDDDFVETIEDRAFSKIINKLVYSGDEYLDLATFDHLGDNEIMGWEIDDKEFLDYRSERDGSVIHYYLKYHIVVSTESNDYCGRDPDTKEVITSASYEHVAEGDVMVKVTRNVDYCLDWESDEFDSVSIESCLLKQTSFIDNNYEEDNNNFNTCPICGRKLTFENDAGNGFCIDCSRQGKADK